MHASKRHNASTTTTLAYLIAITFSVSVNDGQRMECIAMCNFRFRTLLFGPEYFESFVLYQQQQLIHK